MGSEPKAVRLVISGAVQGVGFRWSVERVARRAGVTGWVRNLADGRVEAWIEGGAEAVDAVTGFCRRGPDGARVAVVDSTAVEPEGAEDFRIR